MRTIQLEMQQLGLRGAKPILVWGFKLKEKGLKVSSCACHWLMNVLKCLFWWTSKVVPAPPVDVNSSSLKHHWFLLRGAELKRFFRGRRYLFMSALTSLIRAFRGATYLPSLLEMEQAGAQASDLTRMLASDDSFGSAGRGPSPPNPWRPWKRLRMES